MNILERANWLAEDFQEGLSLELSEIGILSMASILHVQFGNVAKAARKGARQTAFFGGVTAFFVGMFVGVSLWIIICGGW